MHEMPRPTDEHRQLERMIGDWLGHETMSPSPWDPAGGPAEGRVTNRAALDGFAVTQDYEQKRNGEVSFRGHGVFQYDPKAGEYMLYWWDSMGFPPNVFRGRLENDVLTMTTQGEMGYTRCHFDLSRVGHYGFSMEMSQDGREWMKAMSGDYAPAPKATAARSASAKSGDKKKAPAKKTARSGAGKSKARPAKAKQARKAKKPAAKKTVAKKPAARKSAARKKKRR